MAQNSKTSSATPNGQCWCGCGAITKPGSFFLQGHDKRAERYLAAVDGGQSIAQQLASRGYVPGVGRNLRTDTLAAPGSNFEECGLKNLDGQDCQVIGQGVGIRQHRADDAHHQAA